MSRTLLPLAGFEVITNGRFWVITEVKFLFALNPYETINTPIPGNRKHQHRAVFDPIDRSVEYLDHSEHTQKALACDSQSLANFLAWEVKYLKGTLIIRSKVTTMSHIISDFILKFFIGFLRTVGANVPRQKGKNKLGGIRHGAGWWCGCPARHRLPARPEKL